MLPQLPPFIAAVASEGAAGGFVRGPPDPTPPTAGGCPTHEGWGRMDEAAARQRPHPPAPSPATAAVATTAASARHREGGEGRRGAGSGRVGVEWERGEEWVRPQEREGRGEKREWEEGGFFYACG